MPYRIVGGNPNTGEYYPDIEFVLSETSLFAYRVGELDGYGGQVYVLGVNIPQSLSSYKEFAEQKQKTEEVLFKSVSQIVAGRS